MRGVALGKTRCAFAGIVRGIRSGTTASSFFLSLYPAGSLWVVGTNLLANPEGALPDQLHRLLFELRSVRPPVEKSEDRDAFGYSPAVDQRQCRSERAAAIDVGV